MCVLHCVWNTPGIAYNPSSPDNLPTPITFHTEIKVESKDEMITHRSVPWITDILPDLWGYMTKYQDSQALFSWNAMHNLYVKTLITLYTILNCKCN